MSIIRDHVSNKMSFPKQFGLDRMHFLHACITFVYCENSSYFLVNMIVGIQKSKLEQRKLFNLLFYTMFPNTDYGPVSQF